MKIQKFIDYNLNEKLEQYDFNFNTKLNPAKIDINAKLVKEQYVEAGDMNVEWEMIFDNNKNGIINMHPEIKRVNGTYNIITPNDDTDEKEEVIFDTKLDKWEFDTSSISKIEFGYNIFPTDIEIDFKTKKININF